MENLVVNPSFWHGKRVLVTGHTGFKGSWLCLWLQRLGALVAGYALPAESQKSLFDLAAVGAQMESLYADIRSAEPLADMFDRFRPEVVFHLAAQPLVRQSYLEPLDTYQINVMGTVHLFEAIRRCRSCRVVINVTSDKCYENKEWVWGYRESDPLGGHDPYSSSKGCSELITSAYRSSFFAVDTVQRIGVATARAGNVIGGGDFSKDRIIPDFMAAHRTESQLYIRCPDAIRPWQHVLEPLSGYLLLAERLWGNPELYSESWNFGPPPDDTRPVRWIVQRLNDYCGRVRYEIDTAPKPHEAGLLLLDSSKARLLLGWKSRWSLEQALRAVVDWYRAYDRHESMRDVVMQQISEYEGQSSTAHVSSEGSAPSPNLQGARV